MSETPQDAAATQIHDELCRGYQCNGYRCEVKDAAAAGFSRGLAAAAAEMHKLRGKWRSDAKEHQAKGAGIVAGAMMLAAYELKQSADRLAASARGGNDDAAADSGGA